jgi:hypothetical protein
MVTILLRGMMTSREHLKQLIDGLNDAQLQQLSLFVEFLYFRQQATPNQRDPMIGLFAGSPHLAAQADTILQQDLQSTSGWTWKQASPTPDL